MTTSGMTTNDMDITLSGQVLEEMHDLDCALQGLACGVGVTI